MTIYICHTRFRVCDFANLRQAATLIESRSRAKRRSNGNGTASVFNCNFLYGCFFMDFKLFHLSDFTIDGEQECNQSLDA